MHSVEFIGEVVQPGKIVCIGKNYMAHIEEMNSAVPRQMVVFNKPRSSISQTLRAFAGEALHYEGEICLLIRNRQVAGIGFGLDLTKRATQSELKAAGLPWERSKAFDGAALFSAFVPAPPTLDQLSLELLVDGELRQSGGVASMMYPPRVILEELSTFLTLDDNDIVMTGTPAGVGQIKAGQRFEGRILDGEEELVRAAWIAE